MFQSKTGLERVFGDFLQILTSTVQIGVTDPESRHIIIESLAYENNTNLECKKDPWAFKDQISSMDKWVLHIMNVKTLDYDTEAWQEKQFPVVSEDIKITNDLFVVEQDI